MISAVPPLAWAATLTLLAVIVYVDLRVIARRDGEVTLGQSVRWVTFYVFLAVAFGAVLAVGLVVLGAGRPASRPCVPPLPGDMEDIRGTAPCRSNRGSVPTVTASSRAAEPCRGPQSW